MKDDEQAFFSRSVVVKESSMDYYKFMIEVTIYICLFLTRPVHNLNISFH